MVKYLGNMPARSLPTGMELLLRFVAKVAKAYYKIEKSGRSS